MIRGGVAILDEGNRMSEKSWASLAPLLDTRRYIESIVAGIKIEAHSDFRFCATMNDDASTFELPEYVHSRIQPQIFLDFPEREEELKILAQNLPFADEDILNYVVNFLQLAHLADERYTVRDGINIARYALKLLKTPERPKRLHIVSSSQGSGNNTMPERLQQAIRFILGEDALAYLQET
jgi:MoxR-like ATPase